MASNKISVTDLEFDSIISSMTMHHIKNIKNILTTFYNVLKKDSFIALAEAYEIENISLN